MNYCYFYLGYYMIKYYKAEKSLCMQCNLSSFIALFFLYISSFVSWFFLSFYKTQVQEQRTLCITVISTYRQLAIHRLHEGEQLPEYTPKFHGGHATLFCHILTTLFLVLFSH